MIDREQALQRIHDAHMEPHLVQHALAAEAVLDALAVQLGKDRQLWSLTGLLHDLDYPQTAADPARHGMVSADMLADELPPEALHAIRSHNACTGEIPSTPLDYALRCGETVTGLVSTAALVRPTGMEGMQASSLKKKMKDKAFAASVDRDCIRECAHLGLELDAFLTLAIAAMTPHAAALGLVK